MIGEAKDDTANDKYWVPVDKNGVQFVGLDPKLAQRAEPMLRAFKDFAIPAKFPSLSPVILFDQEELLEQYSAGRNWKLALPPGWIELAPFSRQYCLAQEGHPQAYARYIVPDKLTVTIKICSSPKSAEEIIRAFYDDEKRAERESPQNGRFCKEPVEKNGSWKVECATPQNNKILWISSDNGHYSEIEISALKGEYLKPAWELLGTLRTDNPEIFPHGYE